MEGRWWKSCAQHLSINAHIASGICLFEAVRLGRSPRNTALDIPNVVVLDGKGAKPEYSFIRRG